MKTLQSPFDIAEPLVKINLPEQEYDRVTQMRFDMVDPLQATTYNGTQTFDHQGKPRDADNDK
jgi:hypothetical protein